MQRKWRCTKRRCLDKDVCCYECPVQEFCAGHSWDGCRPQTCGYSRKMKSARKYNEKYIAVGIALEGRMGDFECLTCGRECVKNHTYMCRKWKPTMKVSKRIKRAAGKRR